MTSTTDDVRIGWIDYRWQKTGAGAADGGANEVEQGDRLRRGDDAGSARAAGGL